MKQVWVVIVISAVTDFVINFSTALTSSMVEGKTGELPGMASIIIAVLGGLVAGSRTIQQALKGDLLAKKPEG